MCWKSIPFFVLGGSGGAVWLTMGWSDWIWWVVDADIFCCYVACLYCLEKPSDVIFCSVNSSAFSYFAFLLVPVQVPNQLFVVLFVLCSVAVFLLLVQVY